MNGTSCNPDALFWVRKCLEGREFRLLSQDDISGGSGCEVWDCHVAVRGAPHAMILKIFTPGFVDVSGIGPVDTARKCALALCELPKRAIPTPRLFGCARQAENAAILIEKITRVHWNSHTRIEAAESLARLHTLQLDQLSPDFAQLVGRSAPNRHRILLGLTGLVSILDEQHPRWRKTYAELEQHTSDLLESGEPCSGMRALVHGDFFSANLLPGADGLRIIDWEMLALGDPMWDLGFLIGADRDLAPQQVERVIETYSSQSPVDAPVLLWHKRCWDAYWQLKDAVRKMSPSEKARNPA